MDNRQIRKRFALIIFVLGFMRSPFAPLYADTPTENPERIVSLNLCADELLIRLAAPEKIVGLTTYVKTPAAQSVLDRHHHIQMIRGTIEEVMALAPDLVVAGDFSHQGTLRFLEKFKIPVVMISVPKNFNEIYENIQWVAEALGTEKAGEEVIQKMKSDLKMYQMAEPDAEQKQKETKIIFYQRGSYVPGDDTFENEIIRASGGINLAAQLGIKGYGRIPLESLMAQSPDIMLFSSYETERTSVGAELLAHPVIDRRFPHLKKVSLPSYLLNCGSPASVEAVQILAEARKDLTV